MLHTCTKAQRNTAKYSAALILTLASTWGHSQTLSTIASGNHEGFYYSFWKDSGKATLTLEAGGRYTSTWNKDTNNWFGGKGWQSAESKIIQYKGTFEPNGNAYLSLYGWSKSPQIEFYIIESWTTYDPSNCSFGKLVGRYQTDGANYELHSCLRQGAGLEISTTPMYYSMRVPKKSPGAVSGTIDVGRHFEEWRKAGLAMGANDYVIMATEGYQSQGSSDITVSEIPGVSSSSSSSSSSSTSSSSSSNSSSGTHANPAIVGGAIDNKALELILLLAGTAKLRRRINCRSSA
jgi:peptidoglycan-N-acetylglucosamine deacetylase